MSMHASRLRTLAIAASCVCSFAASPAAAQSRFDVLSVDAIAAVKGMNVYTIRDNQIAACYSVFVIDAPDAAPPSLPVQTPVPPPTPEQLEQARVAQALKDAMAIHDRKIAELQSHRLMWSVEYGTERQRIEDEYELAVRQVLPDLHPTAQVAPGWPTSTREELNAAVRRAIAEAEAVPNGAAAARSGIDERLEYLLRRMTAAGRLAVTGPLACPPPPAAQPVR